MVIRRHFQRSPFVLVSIYLFFVRFLPVDFLFHFFFVRFRLLLLCKLADAQIFVSLLAYEFQFGSLNSFFFYFIVRRFWLSFNTRPIFPNAEREFSVHICVNYLGKWLPRIKLLLQPNPFVASNTLPKHIESECIIYAYGMLKQFRINCCSLTWFHKCIHSSDNKTFSDYGDNDLGICEYAFFPLLWFSSLEINLVGKKSHFKHSIILKSKCSFSKWKFS